MTKRQITQTIFTCDNCDKMSDKEKEFPYDKGWYYLYNFEGKVAKNSKFHYDDKHFCSKQCLRTFILKKIDGCDKKVTYYDKEDEEGSYY